MMKQPVSGKFLIDTTGNKDPGKGTTIVVCFSRMWCIDEFFKSFDKLILRKRDFHLLIFDNTDDVLLEAALKKATKKYMFGYRTYRYYKSYRQGGHIRMHQGEMNIKLSKIPAIYNMQKDISSLIKTKEFVQLEDDTLYPPRAVKRLLHILRTEPNCGIATACCTGRSRNKMIKMRLGIHWVRTRKNKIIERLGFHPKLKGLQDCQGCGYFCFAAKHDIWKKGFKEFNRYWLKVPRWGSDVAFTNGIYRLGYRIVADFELWCEHMQLNAGQILYWGREDGRVMADIWIPQYNEYAQGILLDDKQYKKAVKRFL